MAARGIPMEEVPHDAEPISEEQFERFPTYVHELMADSLAGKLAAPSKEELNAIFNDYFKPRVENMEVEEISCGNRPVEVVSNSPSDGNVDIEGEKE